MSKVRNLSHKVLLNTEEERRKDILLPITSHTSVAEHYRYLLNKEWQQHKKEIDQSKKEGK